MTNYHVSGATVQHLESKLVSVNNRITDLESILADSEATRNEMEDALSAEHTRNHTLTATIHYLEQGPRLPK
jgi:uncharacterized coiled-coil protein SlyX